MNALCSLYAKERLGPSPCEQNSLQNYLASEKLDQHALLKDKATYRYAGYRAGMHERAYKGVNPPRQTRQMRQSRQTRQSR